MSRGVDSPLASRKSGVHHPLLAAVLEETTSVRTDRSAGSAHRRHSETMGAAEAAPTSPPPTGGEVLPPRDNTQRTGVSRIPHARDRLPGSHGSARELARGTETLGVVEGVPTMASGLADEPTFHILAPPRNFHGDSSPAGFRGSNPTACSHAQDAPSSRAARRVASLGPESAGSTFPSEATSSVIAPALSYDPPPALPSRAG